MNRLLLDNKICLIVGAASPRSIGYATAELFAEHGARIAVVDVRMDPQVAAEIKASIDRKTGRDADVFGTRCDIEDYSECDRVVKAVVSRYGKIDCLVNCAGIVQATSFLAIEGPDYDRVLGVNLKGCFNICKSVLAVFAGHKRGSIVNLASVAAQRGGGLVGGAHYAASKGGVISLTRSIAREFGPLGIRANVVCPSLVESGMLDGNISREKIDEIIAGVPLGRAGRPSDVAGACLYLASDLSDYVTGATLDVNGGSHIH